MGHQIDIAFLELLSSKICHDLISPIGAIANGIEFMEEMGGDMNDDITDLLKFSAAQASAKLQAYRLAYGAGGGDTSIKPEDVHKFFGKYVELDKKITQDWNPHAQLGLSERPNGLAKLLMCAMLLAVECLPKGGTVTVTDAGNGIIAIRGAGEDAALKSPMDQALSGAMALASLEPRHVHAYMCHLMARQYGFGLSVAENAAGVVVFHLAPPAA